MNDSRLGNGSTWVVIDTVLDNAIVLTRLLKLSLLREIAFMRSSRVRTALRIVIFSRAAACASADVPELARTR
jgi:hypothetical protein